MKTVNTAIPAGFSLQERDRRWDLARDIMRQRNLDVLIVYGDQESAAPHRSAWITILPMTASGLW